MTGEDPNGAQQPDIDELLAKIERSPLGPLLQDEQAANRMMFEAMTRSDDKVVREMGQQLRDGEIGLQDLGDVPAYREALSTGMERLGELDLGGMSDQLDELLAEQEDGSAGQEASYGEREPEVDDDVFQGLWGEEKS